MRYEFSTELPVLFAFGLNHRTASVEVREKLHLTNDEMTELMIRYKDILDECFIISTCNRTEVYGISGKGTFSIDESIKLLLEKKNSTELLNGNQFFKYFSCGAAQHLFRVASGIDSMVVGDSQILSQLKTAYQTAQKNGATGKILNQLCQKALHAGKKAKSETELFEGAVSISYAAVEFAMKIFGDLNDKNVLVLGAGETAELTAESLIKKHVKKIYISNRSRNKAEELLENLRKLEQIDGEVIDFDSFPSRLNEIDIIISSTGAPDHIIRYNEVKPILKKRSHEPILMIDIAVPRDIDPEVAKLGNVFLKNIDDLHAIVELNFEKRKSEFPKVYELIAFEVKEFLSWYHSIPLISVFNHIRESKNGSANDDIKALKKNVENEIHKMHDCILNGCDYGVEKDISCQLNLLNSINDFTKKHTKIE